MDTSDGESSGFGNGNGEGWGDGRMNSRGNGWGVNTRTTLARYYLNGDGNSQTPYGNGQGSGYDLHARGDNT